MHQSNEFPLLTVSTIRRRRKKVCGCPASYRRSLHIIGNFRTTTRIAGLSRKLYLRVYRCISNRSLIHPRAIELAAGGAVPLAAGTRSIFEITSLGWGLDSSPGLRCHLDVCDLDNYCLLLSVTLLVWPKEKTY